MDAVNTNFEARSSSDVCTDSVVLSYFESNEGNDNCAYLKGQLHMQTEESSAETSEAASDAIATNAIQKLGRKFRSKEWTPCSAIINEAVFTW